MGWLLKYSTQLNTLDITVCLFTHLSLTLSTSCSAMLLCSLTKTSQISLRKSVWPHLVHLRENWQGWPPSIGSPLNLECAKRTEIWRPMALASFLVSVSLSIACQTSPSITPSTLLKSPKIILISQLAPCNPTISWLSHSRKQSRKSLNTASW